jgi:hypothetical protein
LTREARVSDFTKLTRPMKRAIRERYPQADIYHVRILRRVEPVAKPKKRSAA